MNSNCIVSQVHVPDYDVQGSLKFEDKLKLIEFGIEHLRQFNKDAYIILTGHGHRPKNLSQCDFTYWNDEQEPLNEHGYVIGMPAQFKYVSRGLEHAKEKGFDRVLKTRGDCIIGIPNINQYCDEILDVECKALLITQQTGQNRMGDCFMYGETKLLCDIWDSNNPVHDPDGLQNTAINFINKVNGQSSDWKSLIRQYCAFRDVDILKFTCLRWNFRELQHIFAALLSPHFDFAKYHWGRANGWHLFDANRNMGGSAAWLWSQKEFYA